MSKGKSLLAFRHAVDVVIHCVLRDGPQFIFIGTLKHVVINGLVFVQRRLCQISARNGREDVAVFNPQINQTWCALGCEFKSHFASFIEKASLS